MNPLADADPDAVLSGRADWLDADALRALSAYPLECVETEYPHYVHSVDGPDGVEPPTERHPVFYGCYDWHSAVHGHWALVRQLRLFDDHPAADDVVASIDGRLTRENAETEAAHLEDDPGFEKPYGWAWLLRLAAELHLWEDPRADEWRTALEPLETTVVDLVASEFLPGDRPFRVGTHGNTAFALAGVLDYARTVGDDELASAAADATRRHFGDDEDYPVEYEPLGWDFVSPALTEADLLRRVLDGDAFVAWLDDFLPDVTTAPYDAVLDPVDVDPDPEEGVALHFVGLNLSRAWCLAGIAEGLDGHRLVDPLRESAARHADAGLEMAFTEDYAGAHWLTSFVLYLLTRRQGGIAPGR